MNNTRKMGLLLSWVIFMGYVLVQMSALDRWERLSSTIENIYSSAQSESWDEAENLSERLVDQWESCRVLLLCMIVRDDYFRLGEVASQIYLNVYEQNQHLVEDACICAEFIYRYGEACSKPVRGC